MKSTRLLATLAASVLFVVLITCYATAQPPVAGTAPAARTASVAPVAPVQASTPIALIDISKIFKGHVRFKTAMDTMKADVEKAEAWVKQEREALRTLAENRKDFKAGTPDYNAIDQQIVTRESNLAAQVRLQKKALLQKEAKIYYQVHQEIKQEVDYYARSNGTLLVLRFSDEQPDPENPQTILGALNKPVVWHNQGLDITDYVLGRLNGVVQPGQPRVGDNRGGFRP